MGHGLALHLLGMAGLGALGLHELQPRRRGEEQVAHLDPRPGGRAPPARAATGAALDREAPGAPRAALLRLVMRQPATEPIDGSASPRKPSVAMWIRSSLGQLGGGVALDRQRQLVGRHAGAVVGHQDQSPAAVPQGDLDAPGAGVEGVLDQLLDRARRPLDHLAGGDAVDDLGRQEADGHDPRNGSRTALPTP